MQSIVSMSPENEHRAILEYAGEVRFGPVYYLLTVDEISFRERIFGGSYLWSPDSRFFAIQEWETTNEAGGPQTKLLLIDLQKKRECVLSRAERGFIIPRKFEGKRLLYSKEYPGRGVVKEFDIEFLSLERWENIT